MNLFLAASRVLARVVHGASIGGGGQPPAFAARTRGTFVAPHERRPATGAFRPTADVPRQRLHVENRREDIRQHPLDRLNPPKGCVKTLRYLPRKHLPTLAGTSFTLAVDAVAALVISRLRRFL